MDFKDYINGLNELDNQENRTKLEAFYAVNSNVLKFFIAVNETVEKLLKQFNINESVIKQLESNLPTLIRLRNIILDLDSETYAKGYKAKIYKYADYIRNLMIISEIDITTQKFLELLENNKKALVVEEINKNGTIKTEKQKNEYEKKLSPIQKAENLILTQGVSSCNARTLWMLAEKSKNAQILELIARENPKQAEDETLAEAYEACTILSVIASNPNTPPDVLYFLAFEFTTGDKDNDEDIRIGVATNPNIPEDIIKRLVIDDSKDVRFELVRNNKTPKDIRENLKNSEGCFVATACYGNYDAPEVLVLRRYRDEQLLTNHWGKLFVKFYYAVSPLLAKRIEKSNKARTFIRHYFLRPIVNHIQNNI